MEHFRVKYNILTANKIPESAIVEIIAGASYFDQMDGVKMSEYWLSNEFSNRDEFFVVLNSYFALTNVVRKNPHTNEWHSKFFSAFLVQLKSNSQSAASLNLLTQKHCYADAFIICRTMLSRVNFLIICALNPNLFDEWRNNPKDEIFLDGHIRKELNNQGIVIPENLYDSYSEIIHSQLQGLVDIGHFGNGLFQFIPSINNEIWVIAKFIIAMSYFSLLYLSLKDYEGKAIPSDLVNHQELFEWIKSNYLQANRIDQIWTFLAEERHVEKVGKNKFVIGRSFDFDGFKEQIDKFYKKSQPKKLSKKYNI